MVLAKALSELCINQSTLTTAKPASCRQKPTCATMCNEDKKGVPSDCDTEPREYDPAMVQYAADDDSCDYHGQYLDSEEEGESHDSLSSEFGEGDDPRDFPELVAEYQRRKHEEQ